MLAPEPGYDNNGTCYGDMTLPAIGFAAQHQGEIAINPGDEGECRSVEG